MENSESKVVVPAECVSELLFRMGGGKFFGSDSDISDLLDSISFTKGDEGKVEKREFCEQGGIIVQRGVVLVRENTHVLLSDRTAHDITKGFSILTSGGGDKTPQQIAESKLSLPDDHDIEFDDLGIALSVPDPKRGNYMFMISRGKVADVLEVGTRTKDTVSFTDITTARRQIADKAMELQVLNGALESA